jgi:hypothetical protein
MAQLGTINLSVTSDDNNGKPSLSARVGLNQQVRPPIWAVFGVTGSTGTGITGPY